MQQPEGESLRRAVRWISQQREEEPGRTVVALVDQAAVRFDLTPKEAEYLLGFFRDVERRAARSGSP
jgi:hypothetical protein